MRWIRCKRSVHENLGELTPAIFRDLRQTPLSAFGGAAGVFLAAAYLRAHHYQNAAASPFLQEPYGKLGARAQKCDFACARMVLMYPKFYILHSGMRSFVALLLRMTGAWGETRTLAFPLG